MSDEAPAGYRWEWMPEGDGWKLADLDRTCRMKGCHNPAVAAIRRQHKGRKFDNFRWWYYCADHIYGRKLENGVVMCRRLVKLEETAA